ncbi:MAG: putative Holliday junction resolvase [Candidatus Paceibacteria bacterium]|jgi:putative Holliday junction resolvase
MKFLGIDYGTKRIGLSVSDDDGKMAFPNSVIETNGFLDKIKEFVSLNGIDHIVIGESKDFDMKDNSIMGDVNDLKESLEESGLKVDLHTELMTSHQVSKETFSAFNDPKSRKEKKKDDMLDAKAATIMLQNYLDTKSN